MNRAILIVGLVAIASVVGVLVGPSIAPSLLIAQVDHHGGGGPTDDTPVASGWTDDGAVVRLTTPTDSVGIGTNAPSKKLDVIGDIALTGLIDGVDLSLKAPDWDTAFLERRQWDGGSTNLNVATGRTSLGLGSLATLNAVGGGSGGTITDKTITSDDLSFLSNIILKDTDGPNCHKITVNSVGTLSTMPVNCNTGNPVVMGAFDNFDSYPSGALTAKNGGTGWGESWQTRSGFASAQIQTSFCQSNSCVKASGSTETFDSRKFSLSITNGRVDFYTKVVKGGGASHNLFARVSNLTSAFVIQTRSDAPGDVVRLIGATTENLGTFLENAWQHVEAEFGDTGGSGICGPNQVRARLNGGAWSSCLNYLSSGDVNQIEVNYANNTNAEYWVDELAVFKD